MCVLYSNFYGTHILKDTPAHCESRPHAPTVYRFLTLTNNNTLFRVAAVNVYVSRNEVKKQSQSYLSIVECDVDRVEIFPLTEIF